MDDDDTDDEAYDVGEYDEYEEEDVYGYVDGDGDVDIEVDVDSHADVADGGQ